MTTILRFLEDKGIKQNNYFSRLIPPNNTAPHLIILLEILNKTYSLMHKGLFITIYFFKNKKISQWVKSYGKNKSFSPSKLIQMKIYKFKKEASEQPFLPKHTNFAQNICLPNIIKISQRI